MSSISNRQANNSVPSSKGSLDAWIEENSSDAKSGGDISGMGSADAFSGGRLKGMSANHLKALLNLAEAYKEELEGSGTKKLFMPDTPFSIERCPKHKAFFDATRAYREVIYMAGNRVGKTSSGAFAVSCWATGEYPEWWEGKTFSGPTTGWVVGDTHQTTRDVIQNALLGPPGAFGTGLIPRDRIARVLSKQGVPNGIESVEVKHVSGGISLIGFKSYEQGVRSFYGTSKDYIWLDEEAPEIIENECAIRVMTTDGVILLTFTPLHGLTPLIINKAKNADYLQGATPILAFDDREVGVKFAEHKASNHRIAIIQAGWEDAPWLSEEEKEALYADTPPHLRDARRYGKPSIGSGNVYPIPLEAIQVPRFTIPKNWRRLFGMDVGWNRTAVLFAAVHPDSDCIYLYDELYLSQKEPDIVASFIKAKGGDAIPGVIDPSANGRSSHDGRKLLTMYRQLGLKLKEADNAVESGIQETWSRMSAGQLKVFDDLHSFAKEYVVYRRDLKGSIVKKDDHEMDAMRYIIASIDYASIPNTFRGLQANMQLGAMNNFGARKYDI